MSQIKTYAVKLKPNAERLIKKGHPWVYSDSILKIADDAQTGDICILFDHRKNSLYAVGLYDENSPIRIKIIHRKKGTIDAHFFQQRIQEALVKRQALISEQTNSYRLLYGENDFLPGVIADVYDHTLVLKLYSAAWLPYLDILKEALLDITKVTTIVLRLSRNVEKELNDKTLNGSVIQGKLASEDVIFKEHKVYFSANVIKGHKTGFFLDHRLNRKKIGELAKNKTVLDVFAYAGGFSVHALVGGAKEVTSVDISEQALEMAKQNVALNSYTGTHTTIAGDAFEVLQQMIASKKTFDIVIIDPPSFAKSKEETATALKKYTELAEIGVKLTKKGGVLLLASCSSRVSLEDLKHAHQIAFANNGVLMREIETTQHDVDHPIVLEESAYLKSVYYRKS